MGVTAVVVLCLGGGSVAAGGVIVRNFITRKSKSTVKPTFGENSERGNLKAQDNSSARVLADNYRVQATEGGKDLDDDVQLPVEGQDFEQPEIDSKQEMRSTSRNEISASQRTTDLIGPNVAPEPPGLRRASSKTKFDQPKSLSDEITKLKLDQAKKREAKEAEDKKKREAKQLAEEQKRKDANVNVEKKLNDAKDKERARKVSPKGRTSPMKASDKKKTGGPDILIAPKKNQSVGRTSGKPQNATPQKKLNNQTTEEKNFATVDEIIK